MIPSGRIEDTTLGDLVGRLHRGRATGTLALDCDGRVHRLKFRRGYLRAVELEGVWMPLGQRLRSLGRIDDEMLRRSVEALASGLEKQGEALVRLGAISYGDLRTALEEQARTRLAVLARTTRGRYQFTVDDGGTPGFLVDPLPLIRGFQRRRGAAARRPPPRHAPPVRHAADADGDAHRLLGVTAGARMEEIRRAYRKLAFQLHPDRHTDAPEAERQALAARLVRVTHAYQALRSAAR